jgi:hypothetical protein
METIPVQSRIITAMQYDKGRRRLHLEFRNGERRLFSDVPRRLVLEMAKAESPGEFYIQNVRSHFARLAS